MNLNDIIKKIDQPDQLDQSKQVKDSKKSKGSKRIDTEKGNRTKEFQDFFTPEKIAKDLFNEYEKYLKPKPEINKVLEPAVGSGNLIWPLLESDYNVEITCMDIQKDYLEHLRDEAISRGYSLKPREDQLLCIKNY